MQSTDPAGDEKFSSAAKVGGNKIFRAIKKFCLDMLPIIAGVVIGMFVNTYREEQQNQKLVENTLQALSNEFTENTNEIKNKLPRYIRIIDSLNAYTDDTKYNLYEILLKAGGLNTSKISTTNWRITLNNASLQLINFPAVKLLSQIEHVHEEQNKLEDLLMEMAYSPAMYKRGDDGITFKKNLLDMMYNYKGNEEERLQLYHEFAILVSTKQYKQK